MAAPTILVVRISFFRRHLVNVVLSLSCPHIAGQGLCQLTSKALWDRAVVRGGEPLVMIRPFILEEEGVSPMVFQTNSLPMASNSLRLLLKFQTDLTSNSTVHYLCV